MYKIEISHSGLHKYRVIKGTNKRVAKQKERAQLAKWDEMWGRKQERLYKQQLREQQKQKKYEIELQKKRTREQQIREKEEKKYEAQERTHEAQAVIEELNQILKYSLDNDVIVDWNDLLDKSDFKEPKPTEPNESREPAPNHIKYRPKLSFFDRFIKFKKEEKVRETKKLFQRDHQKWTQKHDLLNTEYRDAIDKWEKAKAEFYKEKEENNRQIEERKQAYLIAEPSAIIDYCDMVLSNSSYPDFFPQDFELDYNPENKILIVDYNLPNIEDLPTLKEVKYVQIRDEFTKKYLSKAAISQLSDNLIYQIALRSIHELYKADVVEAIASIVINGIVQSVDKGTGQDISPCILSVQANKDEFLAINLAKVDPKACFKKLKGVAGAKLHSLSPVAPIIQMDKVDKRFVSSYGVSNELNDAYNLAAMDWEDFEQLIRELFEEEFVRAGGEVKVTQASRDGGVDAVAFDPDPIRGGKIVIQAKRYTNTVGVAAVRDLYGTVVNEGATKGILVTTSDYGPDSYQFAKGKPLTLLNGGNLLHLLEKHGHKAKIDIDEARRLRNDQQQSI